LEKQDAQRLRAAGRAAAEAGEGAVVDESEKALQRRERKKADKRRRRKLREAGAKAKQDNETH